jgi:hypothetical protein
MSKTGRPVRDLPPEIGAMPDDCAAIVLAERGETPTTKQGVAYLRNSRGIPPFDAVRRAIWEERRGSVEWTPMPVDEG